jgi:hypothetical protein
MKKPIIAVRPFSTINDRHPGSGRMILRGLAATCGLAAIYTLAALLGAMPAVGQVITIDRSGNATDADHPATVDRRFAQIEPTHVDLPKQELDAKTRQEVIRIMQSEQGFAMRPFPKGHKGLTLVANGKLDPAGEAYLTLITSQGTSAKPGDRVVLTDVKIENSKIIFDLNGGPDRKHRFLRHVQIGSGPTMNPVVQGDDQDPAGARLTLEFKGHIPELTGAQVKSLLAPLISFDVKTPVQAFTDTLPPRLKDAILKHHVIVGMSTEMVLFALGQPESKTREMEGQMPFEEWIYGKPPKDVQFVRINGNRVIRLEVAKIGEKPQIFDQDEVEGMMRTDGTPLAPPTATKTVAMGDTQRNPDTQAPAPPPSLRNPGEALPQDSQNGAPGAMRPVQFPKQKPDEYPDASKLPRDPKAAGDAGQPGGEAKPGDAGAPGSGKQAPAPAQVPTEKPSDSQPQ